LDHHQIFMWGRSVTRSLVVFMTAMTLASCYNEELPERAEEFVAEGKPLVLGKKLINPFAVDNMQRAYLNVQKEFDSVSFLFSRKIEATHWYVRFRPENFEQYDLLMADTSLVLSDHPLDYEILEDGDYYHDPSVPIDAPTYQYACVPVNYNSSSGLAFQILEELFLPNYNSHVLRSTGRTDNSADNFMDALEDEAFQLAGYAVDESMDRNAAGLRKASRWTPSGKITAYDSRLQNYIPIEGVKVQARRWFDVETAYTNSTGTFRMNGSFRKDVKYRIVWERDKFDIRTGTFGQAITRGPEKKGEWNLQIEAKNINFHYAHVFRAAMRYYYGNIGGLKRPGFRLKYSVFDKKGNHMARNIGNWSAFGINPNILIYRYSSVDGTENDSDEMFSAICHETAHTTHMEIMRGVQFLQVSESVRESWAIGVEWYITQLEYKERGIANYGDATFNVNVSYPSVYGFQFWSKKRSSSLTSLFIDLVDNNNQKGQKFGSFNTGSVDDRVSGFTMAELESSVLKESYGMSSLRENVKRAKSPETTNSNIDLFFTYF
jgi:hypothetical protein